MSTLTADTLEPAWEIAHLFPPQGAWEEEDYLQLEGNRLVELSNGHVEVLAMPSELHQLIVLYLVEVLRSAAAELGTVLVAPFRIRLWPGRFCEPDVMFMRKENAARRHSLYWEGADLVVEVVSDDDRRRDLETKRLEYARAGIPEYWIVDPSDQRITVLRLQEASYVVSGEFKPGERASSVTLDRFEIDVTTALQPPQ
jgi:Uma2 family endonuclease